MFNCQTTLVYPFLVLSLLHEFIRKGKILLKFLNYNYCKAFRCQSTLIYLVIEHNIFNIWLLENLDLNICRVQKITIKIFLLSLDIAWCLQVNSTQLTIFSWNFVPFSRADIVFSVLMTLIGFYWSKKKWETHILSQSWTWADPNTREESVPLSLGHWTSG